MDNQNNSRCVMVTDYEFIKSQEEIERLRVVQDKINRGSYSIDIKSADYNKKSETPQLFTNYPEEIQMRNYIGVLAYKDANGINEIRIGSRFDEKEKEQKFLSYMLRKTAGISARTFKELFANSNKSSVFQMLLLNRYLSLIKQSSNRGYFRQYVTSKHNDSRLRGVININDHIRLNPLNNGKIAHDVTERIINNPINVLILLAYDYLTHKFPSTMKDLLEREEKLSEYINKLKNEIPDYKQYDRKSILKKTTKPVTHPYYSTTENLRVVSRDILMDRGLDIFKESNVQVQGILIDVNRLWELFIKTTIFPGNQLKLAVLTDLSGVNMRIEPDYVIVDKSTLDCQMVIDAKHKPKWQTEGTIREDVFQVVAYMNFLKCTKGGVIYPFDSRNRKNNESNEIETSSLSENNQSYKFFRIPFVIPDTTIPNKNGKGFDDLMEDQIEKIKEYLNKEINGESEQKDHNPNH